MSLTDGPAEGGGPSPALPPVAYVAALLSLPAMWPARVAALLGLRRRAGSGRLFDGPGAEDRSREPEEAWAVVRSGRAGREPAVARLLGREADPEVLAAGWAAAAVRMDVARLWADHRRLGVAVDVLGWPGYPPELDVDGAAPYVLFRQGGVQPLAGRRVAIVGTRRCTPTGREIAAELGEAVAAAGARVVSGLALGIDAAAHQGALAARCGAPIGVVAGGFDLPYPVRHRALWRQVADAGVLVSEWPLRTRSEGWRFPARNRIIAALADAVVVVESQEAGGSMITADEALARDVPVLAVPGSIRNPASMGTNKLIRDGAIPVCSVAEVLSMLSLSAPGAGAGDHRAVPSPAGSAVLAAVGWEPTTTSTLLARTGLDPGTLTVQLARLEMDGWISGGGGCWQRLASAGEPGEQTPYHGDGA